MGDRRHIVLGTTVKRERLVEEGSGVKWVGSFLALKTDFDSKPQGWWGSKLRTRKRTTVVNESVVRT